MDLLTYVRALRRRWLVIVACVVVGGAIGHTTTLFSDEPSATRDRTYYRATNTVVVDFESEGSLAPALSNLDQVAQSVTIGEVPQRVADELGTSESAAELGERVVTTANAVTSTLEITAVDSDRERAAELANSFAAQLDATLQARDQERFETAVDDLTLKVDQLQVAADDLFAQTQAVPPPANLETLRRRAVATSNSYFSRYQQLQEMIAGGPASTSVTVLEAAEPEPIDASEYAARLELGATGQNHQRVTTDDTTAAPLVTGTSSSAFNSTFGRTFAGAFLGLLIGIGIALLLDRVDRRMRTRDEVEQAFQLPVLAEVPRLARKDAADDSLVAFTAPLSRAAEAFRAVRTSLVFQQSMTTAAAAAANGTGVGVNGNGWAPAPKHSAGPLVVMVTSAAPREGKSTTSANLAVAFAEGGSSVLVVNCDFRRPTIHRRFDVHDEPRRVQDTKVPGVKIVTNVLTDPTANPSQVVAAQRQVIAAARGRFDVIVVDTAPMLTANDAVGIVSSVDFVLLVAQLDMTTNDNARRVMELLGRVNATVSGVVLVGASDASNEYYYYYQRERVGADAVGAPPEAEQASVPEARDLFESGTDAPGAR